MAVKRYDIISDTHGYLSPELLHALKGADFIVHAGDICSPSDYRTLERIAPLWLCLGNNDWAYDYGPTVKQLVRFYSSGLRWQVCHYRQKLDPSSCDIAICGHTHRPFVEREGTTLVMNPGSPTFPRRTGPTIGRILCDSGQLLSAEIVELEDRRSDNYW